MASYSYTGTSISVPEQSKTIILFRECTVHSIVSVNALYNCIVGTSDFINGTGLSIPHVQARSFFEFPSEVVQPTGIAAGDAAGRDVDDVSSFSVRAVS